VRQVPSPRRPQDRKIVVTTIACELAGFVWAEMTTE
jgi:hypothetical protein